MSHHFLPARDSFGTKFGKAFTPTLMSSLEKSSGEYKKKLLSEKEAAELKKHGIDVMGIPEQLRPTVAKEQLKEKANKELLGELGLGGEARGKLLDERGGQAAQEEEITPEMLKQGLPLYQRLNEDARAKLAIKHPQLANLLEKQSESARKNELEERKFAEQQGQFGKTHGLSSIKEANAEDRFEQTHGLAREKEQRLGEQFGKTHGLNAIKAAEQEQQFRENQQFAKEKHKEEREEKLSVAERKPLEKKTEAFFTKLQEDADKIPQLELSIESMLDAVKNGDVNPFSQAHLADIAESLGVSPSLTKIFQTVGSKEFNTARKSFLGSTLKDTFRGATTKQEINLAESLLAEVGVKPAANQAALFLLQSNLFLKQEEQRLAEEAREAGVSNYEIPNYVTKNLKTFQKQLYDEYIEAVRELRKKK